MDHDSGPSTLSSQEDEGSGSTRLIGAHMPTAGGLKNSLTAGFEIGCTAVQLFTGNPRQWSHPSLTDDEIREFRATHEQTGIPFLVAHDSYLINLAAPAADVLERSRSAFRGELERAHALGIPWVVTHMGSHLDQGEEEAVKRLITSLKEILEETEAEGCTAGVALETTAGQGTGLGWSFNQLGDILKGVGDNPRLGVCMDTCHVFAAGYDIRTPEAYRETIQKFDDQVGIRYLRVIHTNDSKKGLGSRVDRHEHIGMGEIGMEAFSLLLNDSRLLHIPVVAETPDAQTMHRVNVARLRRLAASGAYGIVVTAQLFGHYSDLFPGGTVDVLLPKGAVVNDLAVALTDLNPALSDLASHCRFAIADDLVDGTTALREGCTVAALPPSSGG